MKEKNINNLIQNNNWKNKNEQYLFELQKFMDLADNIENENLRKLIIAQMLKCDKRLTIIAEKMIRLALENK
ncbi:MAG: hypothetical protein BHW00_08345 [Clostridium sp. 26_22]|nr:MAG: hypothetical protein BHW00_08345 [Clostridium sp. 26_22]